MKKDTSTKTGLKLASGIIVFISALIPLHAPLTVWLSSLGLPYDTIRLWKELLLVILTGLAVVYLLKNRKLLSELSRDWLVRLLVAFGVLAGLNAATVLLLGTVSAKAVGFGLIVDTRMILFLLVVLVAIKAGGRLPVPRLIILPAIVVVGFGLMQMSVLPPDALSAIGYGPDTIIPYQAVDNNPDFPRAQSTMRGPNPLGAYLIPVILLLGAGLIKFRAYRWQFATGIIAAMTVLFGTYSRSAWIGTALAVGLLAGWQLGKRWKMLSLGLGAVLLLLGAGGVYVLRDNDYVQNIVFHSSEDSPSAVSSNEQRANALLSGMKDIITHPLGRGIGSAGPASYYNQSGGRLSENFYLQIGQELGVLGLGLYIAVTVVIIRRLWVLRQHIVVQVALAAFIGLIIVNFLSHAWSDDTLAYVMGALLAYALAAYKVSTKSEN